MTKNRDILRPEKPERSALKLHVYRDEPDGFPKYAVRRDGQMFIHLRIEWTQGNLRQYQVVVPHVGVIGTCLLDADEPSHMTVDRAPWVERLIDSAYAILCQWCDQTTRDQETRALEIDTIRERMAHRVDKTLNEATRQDHALKALDDRLSELERKAWVAERKRLKDALKRTNEDVTRYNGLLR